MGYQLFYCKPSLLCPFVLQHKIKVVVIIYVYFVNITQTGVGRALIEISCRALVPTSVTQQILKTTTNDVG